jgi:hypothetical protein
MTGRTRVGILLSTAFYFITILITVLTPAFLASSTAYASGEQYLFYYDTSNIAAIKQGFSNGSPLSSPISSGFEDTSVYAEGGVFGSQPYAFVFNQNALGGSGVQTNPDGSATVEYDSNSPLSCTVSSNTAGNKFMKAQSISSPIPIPYTLTIPLTLDVTLTPADIIAGETTGHDTVNGTLAVSDYSSIGVSYKFDGNTYNSTLGDYLSNLSNAPSGFGDNTGSITSMIDGNCLPSAMKIHEPSNNISTWSVSAGPVQLDNYNALLPSNQKQWPGVQDSATISGDDTAGSSSSSSSSSGGAGALSCDLGVFNLPGILNDFNPLNWLLCGPIDAASTIVNKLDNTITSLLVVGTGGSTTTDNPSTIFAYGSNQCSRTFTLTSGGTESACDAYYKAWAAFRDLALGLLAIACLLVIIAQALGMDILDAYTIRKTLPRIVAGAIILSLSWSLMKFLVTLSNDLGYGVGTLLSAPFSGLTDTFHAAEILTILGEAIAGLALGFFGLFTFLGTAALAVIVAFLTLVFRQIAIVLLIIFSPIAILAYALPNTQRVYRFWWESLSKMLLMFPLIVAIITVGHIFSALSSQSTNSVNQIIAVIAYFGPYFAIPATFRFSGGIISSVGGAVNSRFEGARGALRNVRSNQFKHNMADLQSGHRLKGESIPIYGKFASRFNAATRGAANLPNAGYNPLRMRQRMRTAEAKRSGAAAKDALQNNENLKAIMADDDLVEVGLLYHTDGERQKALEDRGLTKERATQGVAAIRATERSMDHKTFDKAMLIASAGTSSGWTPKYKKNSDGTYATDASGDRIQLNADSAGAGGLRNLINDKMGNDRQGAIDVLGAVRQQAESKGRFDLVGGSFTEDALMLEENNKVARSGGPVDVGAWTKQVHRNALDGQSRAKILNGHNRSLEALAPEMLESLQQTNAGVLPNGEKDPDWTPTKGVEQYAFMASTLDYSSSAAPEMARHIKKQLEKPADIAHMDGRMVARIQPILRRKGVEIYDAAGNVNQNITQADVMEALRTDPEFGEYRREWGRGAEAEQAARIAGGAGGGAGAGGAGGGGAAGP